MGLVLVGCDDEGMEAIAANIPSDDRGLRIGQGVLDGGEVDRLDLLGELEAGIDRLDVGGD